MENVTVIDTTKNNDPEILWLESQDGTKHIVRRDYFVPASETIKNLVEDAGYEHSIPLPNLTDKILGLIIEYAKYHFENKVVKPQQEETPVVEGQPTIQEARTDDIIGWDLDFFRQEKVDTDTLFSIILAANYLDMKELLNTSCKIVANMIKGKTPEEIRKLFNIVNDFTPEEEEQVRKENEWLEEE